MVIEKRLGRSFIWRIAIGVMLLFVMVGFSANNTADAFEGYMQPGPETGDVHHMILIYGNHNANIWSKEALKPYAAHYNANGTYGNTADDFPDDWMYDTFLFLALKQSLQVSFVETNNQFEPAGKAEWQWLLDRWFNHTNGEIVALNQAVGELKTELGDPTHKKKVVIGIPYPNPEKLNFGDVDGDGITEDLSTAAGRNKVVRWFVDEAISRYNAAGFENLELAGFYWTIERIEGDLIDTVKTAANYIHSKPGNYTFSWIPYWKSPSAEKWQSYGFDFAIQQPNLYFNRRILDEDTRVMSTASYASKKKMGVELEIDGKLFTDPGRYWAFMKYLDDGYTYGYMNHAVTGTYQEVEMFAQLRNSSNLAYSKLYDYVYQFLKGTYTPSVPQINAVTPHNLSVVSGRTPVEIQTTSSAGVARVEFYVNDALTDVRTTAPYRMGGANGYWDTSTIQEGTHNLKVVVVDNVGNINTRTWTVDIYHALQNESFEQGTSNWAYESNSFAFSGQVDTGTAYTGSSSYLLSLPTATPTTAGQYAQISQQTVYKTPKGPSYTLQFRVKDSYAGATAGYHMKQVLVNDKVVWSEDVAADGTDWRTIRVNVTDLVENKNSTTIKLRLYEQKGVTSLHANVWFDDVQIYRTLGSGDIEAYYWGGTSTHSNWGSGLDKTQAASGRNSWKISVPNHSTVPANSYGGVAQTLFDITPSLHYSVTFSHKDNYTGSAGKYVKQLLVDNVVAWQKDVASDGVAWESQTVDITSLVTGKSSVKVEFRVKALTAVSNTPIAVNVDLIRSTGSGISLHNYNFEEQDYHMKLVSNSGALDWRINTAKYSGSLGMSMYVKENFPTKAGDYVAMVFDLNNVPNVGATYLEFMQKDTRSTGSMPNYHKMQAYIDNVKVWEKDVASDGVGWSKVSVNITPYLAGKENAVLKLQLYEQNPVTNLQVETNWDDIKLVTK